MPCDFIIQLSKLRKSSPESVDNTSVFDNFKEYLHVERPVENELKQLLMSVNNNQSKCLVLLCGSAGDGKSHLLSFLRNSDSEGLLNDYELYNDATESSMPNLTSIDTLAEKLVMFDDEHWFDDDHKKMIIAINLGTLNNFIESEKGKNYQKLKEYVDNNGIFSGYSNNSDYKMNSVFQHVSFSDYQVFALGEKGVETDFLDNLFEKVFRETEDNPFYKAYIDNSTCVLCKRCPVCHNFSFLSDKNIQKNIIKRIVEVVIKDKAIVSTRDVLNLIYDLIVHPDFDANRIGVGTSDIQYLTDYIAWTTPMLLDDYEDLSVLLNTIRKHDILKIRSSISDQEATKFHSLDNIETDFSDVTEGTPYQVLNNLTDISVLGGIKAELKKDIFRFFARLKAMKDTSEHKYYQQRFDKFVRYLYYMNKGDEKKLKELYAATKKAVMGWDGQFEDDYICIDDSNDRLWVLEQLQLKSEINKNVLAVPGSIQRFSPTLEIKFRGNALDDNSIAKLSIDYALYELILNMREGYRPTVQDKNRHAEFVSFVQQLIEFGNKEERITLLPKESDKSYKMTFEETDFGYEFKVVKQ